MYIVADLLDADLLDAGLLDAGLLDAGLLFFTKRSKSSKNIRLNILFIVLVNILGFISLE